MFYRCDDIVSSNLVKKIGKEKIAQDLQRCDYQNKSEEIKERCDNIIVLPYIKGKSKKLARVYKKHKRCLTQNKLAKTYWSIQRTILSLMTNVVSYIVLNARIVMVCI